MNKKAVIGLITGIAILIFFCVVSPPAGLDPIAMRAVGLLLMGICFWIGETMPMGITALLLLIMMPYLDVMPLADIWKSFISSVIFFMIAVFGLSTALLKTHISERILRKVLSWSQNSSKKLVTGFIMGTAILSSIMSNLPCIILFMGLALVVLKAIGNPKPGTSPLGKCLMIGIPWAAVIGGLGTPIGWSGNILALGLLEDSFGMTVTFLQWTAIGYPVIIIGNLFFAWLLCFIFKPGPVTDEAVASVKAELDTHKNWEPIEKKVVILLLILLAAWFATSWVSFLDTTIIAVAGLVAMFIPGINILNKDEFIKGCPWDIILMVGGVTALASGILSSGFADWLVASSLGSISSWPVLLIIGVISLVAAIMHIAIPAGPALVALLLIPLFSISSTVGIPPVVFMMIVCMWGSSELVLPTDGMILITYSKGYYSIVELMKTGAIATIFMVVLTAVLILPLAKLVGF